MTGFGFNGKEMESRWEDGLPFNVNSLMRNYWKSFTVDINKKNHFFNWGVVIKR